MRNYATAVLGVFVLIALLVPQAFGQQEKLAQTGMKFLSVSLDARAAAMGDAVTAMEGNAAMIFYNPAAIARQEGFLSLAFGQTQWIADINYNQASLSLRPFDGRLGVFGFSLMSIEYGDLEETIRADNEQGFIDVGTFSPSALSFGFAYARALTDRFAVGGQIKVATQDLGSSVSSFDDGGGYLRTSHKESVMAYDFGVVYRTGFRSLNFAFSARNFAEEIVFEEESFQLPLTLKIGVSMDLMDFMGNRSDMHAFLFSVDAENPRDFAEQIKLGGEYRFLNVLALRAGYVFPTDEQGLNLGVGIEQSLGGFTVGADYAYTDFGVFSKVHRVSLHVGL